MKFRDPKNWSALLGAGIIATLALLPDAHSELVLDEEIQPAARVDAKAAAPAAVAQPVAVQTIAVQPLLSTPPVVVEGSEVQPSRAELLRRKRGEEEQKNNDMVQAKLEEARLSEENNRADKFLTGLSGQPAVAPQGPVVMKEQFIGIPASDQIVMTQAAPTAAASTTLPAMGPVVSASERDIDREEKTEILFIPRGGLSTLNSNMDYNIQSRFTAGLGFGVTASNHMTFEVGYAYSEFGASMKNPYASPVVGLPANTETLIMQQNVFDIGLKFHVLGPASKLRPFIGGGGAYARSYVNYDPAITDFYNRVGLQNMAQDFELSSYLGFVSTGFDVRVSKTVSVGAIFKYYTVLSSRQDQNLANASTAYGYGGAYAPDYDKQMFGSSLSKSSFHSILVGASFAF